MEESAILVIGALIGSYVTYFFSRRANQRQWVRDSRMVAYSNFHSAAYKSRRGRLTTEEKAELAETFTHVTILGSAATRESAANIVNHILDDSKTTVPPTELITTFLEAVRADLDLKK